MLVNTPVQVMGPTLDKMYKGCIGIVLEDKTNKSIVGFYHPQESGKNPFVMKVEFHDEDLHPIGELKFKPNK